jgi:hypothetical protein
MMIDVLRASTVAGFLTLSRAAKQVALYHHCTLFPFSRQILLLRRPFRAMNGAIWKTRCELIESLDGVQARARRGFIAIL